MIFPWHQSGAQVADGQRHCMTPEMSERLEERGMFPHFTTPSFKTEDKNQMVLVPVVFHVIHEDGQENLHDSLLQNQIEVLNEDYGRYGGGANDDPAGADARIRFCLASIDPNGNPSNGVVRVKSPLTDLLTEEEMLTKDLSRWPVERYLNIWIVRSIDGNSRTQGYSYYASQAANQPFDGVVMVYRFVGRNTPHSPIYRLGHTMSHEVGHYFNLPHPWGSDQSGEGGCDDDDGIDDTPLCSGQFFASPPLCPEPEQCGFVRQTANFMDYSTDDCMNVFTAGQKKAMRDAIFTYRPELTTFTNLVESGCQEDFIDYSEVTEDELDIYYRQDDQSLILNALFDDRESVTVMVYNVQGKLLGERTFPEILIAQQKISLGTLSSGLYVVKALYGGIAKTVKIVVY
ncbi:MAG: zinc-dependent metalloprotease [Bacteroidia bacterium]